jgi:hypothetical protein
MHDDGKTRSSRDSIHSIRRPPHIHGWRFVDLIRNASSATLIRAAIAAAIAWVPPAILSAFRGTHIFLSFLTDYAALTRFLIVIPILILAEQPLHSRYALVAHHFDTTIPDDEKARFNAHWRSHETLKDSIIVRIILILGSLALAAWLSEYLHPEGSEFLDWSRGPNGLRSFSLSATWEIFVSYPILAYFALNWIWKQIVWSRFLRSTTHLNLRLIAVHPDHLGGLGFLEASLLAQLPFSFCLGVGLAGAIANRVFHEGQNVMAYRFLAPVLIALALLISVVPYFLFTPTLIQMRRRGMLKYGALARAVGEKFEQKWLDHDDSLSEDVLVTPDFSSTRNLFGIVDYVDDIRVVPISLINVYLFVIAALIPCIPVVIAAIPFSVIMKLAMKLLA